jgi:hypothetical protein
LQQAKATKEVHLQSMSLYPVKVVQPEEWALERNPGELQAQPEDNDPFLWGEEKKFQENSVVLTKMDRAEEDEDEDEEEREVVDEDDESECLSKRDHWQDVSW